MNPVARQITSLPGRWAKPLISGPTHFQRLSTTTSSRTDSTPTASKAEESAQGYVPGVCGYAPGFDPPKGWPRTLQPKKPPMTAADLEVPAHPRPPVTNTMAAKLAYRRLYKETRYTYRHDDLQLWDDRRDKLAQQQRVREARQKAREAERQKARDDFVRTVQNDPLSADNVLNPEGKTVHKHADVFADLANGPSAQVQAFATAQDRAKYYQAREIRRRETKQRVDNEHRHQLRSKLVGLYYNAHEFITHDNVDEHLERMLAGPSSHILSSLSLTPAIPSASSQDRRASGTSSSNRGASLIDDRVNELELLMNGEDDQGRLSIDVFEEHEAKHGTKATN
ncbi:hypothetical protein H4R35_004136 [Dimargaris xerosporica]|nr:hypothetical protein H4R35_004136 [Dimargaris xerosporica]